MGAYFVLQFQVIVQDCEEVKVGTSKSSNITSIGNKKKNRENKCMHVCILAHTQFNFSTFMQLRTASLGNGTGHSGFGLPI